MDYLNKLFEIIKQFNVSQTCEITFECNINDIDDNLLKVLSLNGVNRLSIGVESFNDKNLEFMNRKHNKKDVFNKIKLCRAYEFDNINVDLIYALPCESFWTLKSDVSNILKLGVEHLVQIHNIHHYPNMLNYVYFHNQF